MKNKTLKEEVLSTGKHSIVYGLGQVLSRAVGFFMIPVYTHYLAPDDYGILELIGIISSCLALLICMSISDSMSRYYYAETSKENQNQVVYTIIIGFSAIGLLVVGIFSCFSNYIAIAILESPKYESFFTLAFITTWFTMLIDIGLSYLRIKYFSKIFVFFTTLRLVMALSFNIFFLVYKKYGIIGILYSSLIADGVVGTILIVGILFFVKSKFSKELLVRIIKFGLPLVPARLALSLGFMSNRFFLQRFSTLAELGIFSLGYKFGILISQLVNTPINLFWGPRRMEILLDGDQNAFKTLGRICTYGTLISVIIALGLSSTIESFIMLIADERYWNAYKVVPIIAFSIAIGGLENHVNAGILYMQKTKYISYVSFVALGIVLLWNIIFIPYFGMIGAATGILISTVFRVVSIYFISQYLYPIPYEIRRIFKIFLVAFMFYILTTFICFSSPLVTFSIRVNILLAFPISLWIFGFFESDEKRIIIGLIKKLRVIASNFTS